VNAPRRDRVLYTSLAALAAYTLLLVLRAPNVWRGRFWAEEGTVFFSAACESSLLASLFAPHLGYLTIVPNFAATLAARWASLELAPLVTTAFAAAVQLLPAVLVLTARIDALPDVRWRAIALALLLFSLPSEETWLNSPNSSHYLGVCAGILLIARPSQSRVRFLHLALLVLAGLGGIDANLLVPFFWLRAFRERSRGRVAQAAALTVCAGVQALVVAIAPGYGFESVGIDGPRSPRLDLQVLAHAVFAKDILLPFAGRALTEHVMTPLARQLSAHEPTLLVSAIVILWAVLFALAVARSGQWQPRLSFGLSLFVVFVSFTASIEASQPDWHLSHASALGAGRYYLLPNFFLGLALLMLAGPASALHRRSRQAALVLVAWMLVVGANEFFRTDARPWFFAGPNWQREVAAWRRGEARDLAIWPAPWKLRLDGASSLTGCRR
jgi:hypothetical protein